MPIREISMEYIKKNIYIDNIAPIKEVRLRQRA